MRDRPRLLILSLSPLASDARVLKQIRGFAQRYDVTTCGFGPSPLEGVRHLEVSRRPATGMRGRFPALYGHLGDALAALRLYRGLYWSNADVRAAWTLLKNEAFDAIIANDVDAVPLALRVGPGRMVHVDLHEYWPRLRENHVWWRRLRAPYYAWICRRFVAAAASVTTVGQGIADEYRRQFGFSCGVVQNASPYLELPVGEVGGAVRLVHSGVADATRGLDRLIDAAIATTADVTLDLYLVPGPLDFMAYLQGKADASEGRVTIRPPLPYVELVPRLNTYDIGVYLLQPATFNHAWALPNKIFDFVQARLGLITGPSPEMATLVREQNLGVVADGFEAADLTRVLDDLSLGDVRRWKANSADASRLLSAENQQHVWEDAVARIVAGPVTPAHPERASSSGDGYAEKGGR